MNQIMTVSPLLGWALETYRFIVICSKGRVWKFETLQWFFSSLLFPHLLLSFLLIIIPNTLIMSSQLLSPLSPAPTTFSVTWVVKNYTAFNISSNETALIKVPKFCDYDKEEMIEDAVKPYKNRVEKIRKRLEENIGKRKRKRRGRDWKSWNTSTSH